MTEAANPKDKMFAEIEESYQRFLAEIDALTEAEWLFPTDDAGWTVKDHVMHCAVWAGSMTAVIDKQPRWEGMGVPIEVWKTISKDYDQINEVIRQNHLEDPPAAVRAAFVEAHQTLIGKAQAMSIADLALPYAHYQTYADNQTAPLYGYIQGNSGGHYAEHLEYIRKLLQK